MDRLLARAAMVELVAFDCDGVLTDGRLLLGDDGVEHKAFHVRDGHAMRMLAEAGIGVAIVTGRSSRAVELRAAELGIEHLVQGCRDKVAALGSIGERAGVAPAAMAFVGDDLVDLPAMRCCALAVAVADAHPRVREYAHWCTSNPGGRGAAREVCELVLRARGLLAASEARWLDPAAP